MERSKDSTQDSKSHDQQVVKPPFWHQKWFQALAGLSLVLFFLIGLMVYFTWGITQRLQQVKTEATVAYQAFEARDLASLKQHLQTTQAQFDQTYTSGDNS